MQSSIGNYYLARTRARIHHALQFTNDLLLIQIHLIGLLNFIRFQHLSCGSWVLSRLVSSWFAWFFFDFRVLLQREFVLVDDGGIIQERILSIHRVNTILCIQIHSIVAFLSLFPSISSHSVYDHHCFYSVLNVSHRNQNRATDNHEYAHPL